MLKVAYAKLKLVIEELVFTDYSCKKGTLYYKEIDVNNINIIISSGV